MISSSNMYGMSTNRGKTTNYRIYSDMVHNDLMKLLKHVIRIHVLEKKKKKQ